MDPKTLSSLDPKLRETYERVMGAQTPPSTLTGTAKDPSATAYTPNLSAGLPTSIINPSRSADLSAIIPIPPPSPDAPASPLPAIDTPAMPTADQPNQAADLASLQPSFSAVPNPASPASVVELSQPPQPLPSPASINQAAKATASTSPLIRTLYFIAGIIFFVVYAFFWLKIFNYPLPF